MAKNSRRNREREYLGGLDSFPIDNMRDTFQNKENMPGTAGSPKMLDDDLVRKQQRNDGEHIGKQKKLDEDLVKKQQGFDEDLTRKQQKIDEEHVRKLEELASLKEQITSIRQEIQELTSRRQELLESRKGLEQELYRTRKEQEQELTARGKELEDRKRDLTGREKELADRERSIMERELEARNGFAKLNLESLALLQEEKERLEKDILALNTSKVAKTREIDEFLANHKQRELLALENGYAERKKQQEIALGKLYREREQEILSKEKEIQGKVRELEDREKELEQMALETTSDRKQLRAERENFEAQKAELLKKQQLELEAATFELRNDIEHRDSLIQSLTQRIDQQNTRLEDYERVNRQSGGKSMKEMLQELDTYRERCADLEVQLLDARKNSYTAEIKAKVDAYDRLLLDYQDSEEKVNTLERELIKLRQRSITYDAAQTSLDIIRKKSDAVEALMEQYSMEVRNLRSMYERPEEEAARRKDIENNPPFLAVDPVRRNELEELDWLSAIYDRCNAINIVFPKRLLLSFHTALKTAEWSPITVLAGVSGTGKSLLPKLYSHFGGLYYLSMPVQPDWDSPQSIFGYFNSLDNTFNATDLLKAMVQFQDKNAVSYDGGNDLSDRMLLVLLDEMNLAHVELYFSDMLSKLEERRGDRENVSIHIDLGGNYRYKVGLSPNVLWVGTMNEDETTKSLSDKVIDRSCLVSFPRPKTFERRSNPDIGEKGEYLGRMQWEKWCNSRLSPEQLVGIEQYKVDLEKINEALEVVGRALGHRVWQAIENYIANHPRVIKAYREQDNLEQEMQLAFEEALVYKVMPKLRGIEITRQSKEDCFDRIQAVIDESAPNLREDFAKALNSTYGLFVWSSSQFLDITV